MFVRPCWKPGTREEMFDLIDQYPWALLISNGADGPLATNLPLLLDRSKGENGVLVGHIAAANDHAKALRNDRSQVLAVFEGPYSYVTGSWYPNRDMPSTYYYTAVHCYGTVQLQSRDELERWIGILTDCMESHFPDGWKITDVDHPAILRRLNHIVGFEIPIERLEGKFKLGQDEPKKDAMAVARKLEGASDSADHALSGMIRLYNQKRPDI